MGSSGANPRSIKSLRAVKLTSESRGRGVSAFDPEKLSERGHPTWCVTIGSRGVGRWTQGLHATTCNAYGTLRVCPHSELRSVQPCGWGFPHSRRGVTPRKAMNNWGGGSVIFVMASGHSGDGQVREESFVRQRKPLVDKSAHNLYMWSQVRRSPTIKYVKPPSPCSSYLKT